MMRRCGRPAKHVLSSISTRFRCELEDDDALTAMGPVGGRRSGLVGVGQGWMGRGWRTTTVHNLCRENAMLRVYGSIIVSCMYA